MEEKITVMCDIDDTLWDLVGAWINYYGLETSDILNRDNCTTWDIVECLSPKYPNKFWGTLYDKKIWENMHWYVNSKTYSTLKEINDMEWVDLYIVTDTRYPNATIKLGEFHKIFDFLEPKQIITCSDKGLLKGDIFIDDKPKTIIQAKENGAFAVCVSQVWNKGVECDLRVDKFCDILKYDIFSPPSLLKHEREE